MDVSNHDREWVKVCSASAIDEGEVIGVEVRGKLLALYNIDGEILASDNVCTHAFALLSDGWLDGDVIECPLHAGRFEVRTGKAIAPPVEEDIRTYPVRVVDGEIEIGI